MQVELPQLEIHCLAKIEMLEMSDLPAKSEGQIYWAMHRDRENKTETVLIDMRKLSIDAFDKKRCNLRAIDLFMEHPNGGNVEISLIRSTEWIRYHGVTVAKLMFLDMSEMGARGWAKVLAITPCPPIDGGRGRMVTGTFRHSLGRVGELKIKSELEPIKVTKAHLFWSVDQNKWVSAVDLREGECVKTLDGYSHVEWFKMRSNPEPVYNIEVEGDHAYRVGQSGILVHNISDPETYNKWFNSLKKCHKFPSNPVAAACQKKGCGSTEYMITGGGISKCADGIKGTSVLECKAVLNENSSPQLGNAPEFLAKQIIEGWVKDLNEYETIINDPCNPLEKLIIVVCDSRTIGFWKSLLSKLTIPTDVVEA
tara:strand:- start:6312 stop:7415 length:1104 start_codon:yes stop_codon:yes gene_type:complete